MVRYVSWKMWEDKNSIWKESNWKHNLNSMENIIFYRLKRIENRGNYIKIIDLSFQRSEEYKNSLYNKAYTNISFHLSI